MAVGDKKPVVMESDKAAANGVATLGSNGLVPPAQLASGTAGEGYVPTIVNGAVQWLPQSGGGGSGNIVAKTYYATLTASGWTGSAAPYSQTVSIGTTLTAGQGALIGAASTANIQQRYACRAAVISVSAVGTNTITVIADGVKPVVDIPAEIVIFAGESDYYTKSVTDALLAGKADTSEIAYKYERIGAVAISSTAGSYVINLEKPLSNYRWIYVTVGYYASGYPSYGHIVSPVIVALSVLERMVTPTIRSGTTLGIEDGSTNTVLKVSISGSDLSAMNYITVYGL